MMQSLSSHCLRFLLALLVTATLTACGDGTNPLDNDGNDAPRTGIEHGFESDEPSTSDSSYTDLSEDSTTATTLELTAAGNTSSADENLGSDSANRAIEEADLIRVEGTRLYALSNTSGLAVIDITDPDNLKLLGRKVVAGTPFEMYIRDHRAYLMTNDSSRWISQLRNWVQSSRMIALDITDPTSILELSTFDVPGHIADSRMVGDALYLVTHENGYCWGCSPVASTKVTSFLTTNGHFSHVQQLTFSSPNPGYNAWRRSVAATNERLYIAGPEWNWHADQPIANSVIQVVDITDPWGKLQKGADIPVAGQINSRWQMDEYQNILRVISQFGGNTGAAPVIQTFQVTDAHQITPLGKTEIKLPRPETLRSVRFDGPRAYAITAERTDPLFTIDLSNPAIPQQMGELEMPGWIFHMEPRGDRLVGFGFDSMNWWNARLQASLFDVSDLSRPTLIQRVAFGSAYGSFAEDQDRIHKSIRVLDDQNTILVPFSSWGDSPCSGPNSGIQIIDYTRDSLALRGIAPQQGMARRAELLGDRLLGVSVRNVTTFDISSRDAPIKTSEIDLIKPADKLTRIGDQIATVAYDWNTREAIFSLTPAADPETAEISGKLPLNALSDETGSDCNTTFLSHFNWYRARIFSVGTNAVVAVPVTRYENNAWRDQLVIGVIDTTDPTTPRLISKTKLTLDARNPAAYFSWPFWAYFNSKDHLPYWGRSYANMVNSGDGIVQIGSKLAFLEAGLDVERIAIDKSATDTRYRYPTYRYTSNVRRKLHVIDFAEGAAPRVSAPIDLGNSPGALPLHKLGSTVLSTRWTPPTADNKTKFYIDRVDLTGNDPVLLPGINVPGSLLAVDEPSNRLVTVDYSRVTRSEDRAHCLSNSTIRQSFDDDAQQCISIRRTLKLLDLDDTNVTLRQTWEPPTQNIQRVLVADDRIYVANTDDDVHGVLTVAESTAPATDHSASLWAIGGLREGTLKIVSEFKSNDYFAIPIKADGPRVALVTSANDTGLTFLDTSTQTPVVLADPLLRGSHRDILFETDRAIVSLGDRGMQVISLGK